MTLAAASLLSAYCKTNPNAQELRMHESNNSPTWGLNGPYAGYENFLFQIVYSNKDKNKDRDKDKDKDNIDKVWAGRPL